MLIDISLFSAAITTKDLVGFIIFEICYGPLVWFVKPHQFQRVLLPGLTIITITLFGILGWAIHSNNGSPGNLWSSTESLSGADRAFRIVQCIVSITGIYGGASERFSDWTRFAKSRQSPTVALVLGAPFCIVTTALIGVLATSATYQAFGTLQWNPVVLLQAQLDSNYSASCRAGVFFAGLGFFLSQMAANMANSTVGWGMDMAGIFPRYLSMQRAAMVLVVLTLIAQPWRFLSQAYIFVQILSICSSMTRLLITFKHYLIDFLL